jgi:hypothetical protein
MGLVKSGVAVGLGFVLCGIGARMVGPERVVRGNVITSAREPAVRIALPVSVNYLGAERFVLYGIADCELHGWVEAGAGRKVSRLYWVQFEGYLPTKPELHHTYDSPRRAGLGGMDFYVDTWVRRKDDAIEAGSDREHIEGLIRGKGYSMPAGMMYVRFVHLLDAEKRKELMIIYGEDLAGTGLTAAELKEGGAAHDRWPTIDQGLIERAAKAIAIRAE